MKISSDIHNIHQRLVRKFYEANDGSDGFTLTQMIFLNTVETVLAKKSTCSQTDIVVESGIDRSTVADITRRLLSLNYINRKRSKDDDRENNITMTANCRAKFKRELKALLKVEKEVAHDLCDRAETWF